MTMTMTMTMMTIERCSSSVPIQKRFTDAGNQIPSQMEIPQYMFNHKPNKESNNINLKTNKNNLKSSILKITFFFFSPTP